MGRWMDFHLQHQALRACHGGWTQDEKLRNACLPAAQPGAPIRALQADFLDQAHATTPTLSLSLAFCEPSATWSVEQSKLAHGLTVEITHSTAHGEHVAERSSHSEPPPNVQG